MNLWELKNQVLYDFLERNKMIYKYNIKCKKGEKRKWQ